MRHLRLFLYVFLLLPVFLMRPLFAIDFIDITHGDHVVTFPVVKLPKTGNDGPAEIKVKFIATEGRYRLEYWGLTETQKIDRESLINHGYDVYLEENTPDLKFYLSELEDSSSKRHPHLSLKQEVIDNSLVFSGLLMGLSHKIRAVQLSKGILTATSSLMEKICSSNF